MTQEHHAGERLIARRDLDFQLYEVLGLEDLLREAHYDGLDRAAIDAVVDAAYRLARERFAPCAARLDAQEPQLVDGRVQLIPEVGQALRDYVEGGFMGLSFDREHGGLQLPFTAATVATMIFCAANQAINGYPFLTIAAANLLSAHGSPGQQQRYMLPMVQGRWFGTMCLSEPQAGSSLADIRCSAEPLGDGRYRIKGSKMWISAGDHELSENIVHLVLAKIPGGPPGVKGISLFIVPKYRLDADGRPGPRNGVELAGLNHKMGQRGTTNCLLSFGQDGECVGELVGAPHAGMAQMFHMMNEARIGVGAGAVCAAYAGYLHALEYARQRPQGRPPGRRDPALPQVPIIEHADVRRMLLLQKAYVEGGLALTLHCAMLVDRLRVEHEPQRRNELRLLLEMLTPIAKTFPSEYCLQANHQAIQVLGGAGYTRDFPLERLYRDNRLNAIHEGTTGIQALDLLGRKARMEGGEALRVLLARIEQTAAAAPPDLGPETAALRKALRRFENTSAILVATCDQGREAEGLANATLYLEAAGLLVIAWMWLRQAGVATYALEAGHGPEPFYRGKLRACRYFFRYDLPRLGQLCDLLDAQDDTCLGAVAEDF